jgi:hypothetical protein
VTSPWHDWVRQVAACFPDGRLPKGRVTFALIDWWSQEVTPEVAARWLGLGVPPEVTCTCGAAYTEATWAQLNYRGTQVDDLEASELRQCQCGRTLALVISEATKEDSNET